MKMSELKLPEGVRIHEAKSAGQLAQDLARDVAALLADRLARAERASLVVSGGSTPVPFFQALSLAELDWSRVDVTLADERWVPEGDPASNTTLVRRHLLRNRAASARYLPLKQPGETPEQGLAAVREVLSELTRPIEVLVLGMGNDGHTASLFPDAPELLEALAAGTPAPVSAMTPASQPQRRVTLTYPILGEARHTLLHLKGHDKLETLARALAHPGEVAEMPIRAFLKPGLAVYWSP